ncbi:MAG: hypothetical protein LBS86_02650 [Treponema sp.]|jgi:hypothetical protein|nr:hypothetical protein [Treponema sp.]
MKIKPALLSTPLIFSGYMLVSCLVIVLGSFFAPAEQPPLAIYSRSWRLVSGLVTWFQLFPALVFSGLVLPFGVQKSPERQFPRFSPHLLDYLKPSIITGIIAVIVYGLIFFLAAPLARDHLNTLRYRSYLYNQSKERAEENAAHEQWPEAAQLFRICQWMWPDNPATEKLAAQIEFGMDSWRLSSMVAGPVVVETETPHTTHPMGIEVEVQQALGMANTAFEERRFFDAHWLAMLTTQLARQGTPEERSARSIASYAWNELDRLSPSAREQREYALFRQKRAGYNAILAEEWIQAYYIFKELIRELPEDPDVVHFFAASEEAAAKSAFFIDEMEERVGEILPDVVFSLPLGTDERSVLRIESLSSMQDISYGRTLELIAFDRDGSVKYRITTPYVKLLPFRVEGKEKLLIMLRGLDRQRNIAELEPVWEGPEMPSLTGSEIVLDLTYSDFLLLSKLRRGLDALSLNELYTASVKFADYGYIPEVFQADILYRLSEPGSFLPLVIFIVIIGWHFRAFRLPRFLIAPMLVMLPIMFYCAVLFYRNVLNSLSIDAVISFGFFTAISMFAGGLVLIFIISLVLLSAQHS